MNSPELQEIAAAFAARIMAVTGDSAARIDAAHRWCFARTATSDDQAAGLSYLQQYQTQLASTDMPVEDRERAAWTSFARLLIGSNEFFYVD